MAEIDDNTDSMSSNSNNAGTCVVCYKNVEIYSIGMCEHPVCYECSTRMRVLCRQNECPICRQDLPKVVFTRQIKPFRHLRKGKLFDERYNIYFDDLEIQEEFTKLLAHVCSYCEGKEVFSSFNSLKDHMRRKHERHYCDLCVENLKIFSFERRCYSRADLAQHRRKGDRDDKSHKGHPLCEFCDCRYMDNDELFRHLRRDHLFCHFCDADGLHQYYSSYHYLREHFRQEHYLCEEGTCAAEQFTSVFRTDIDLKAHKATAHGKHLGKHAAKQARTLELEFAFAPRENRNGRMARSMGAGSRNYNSDHGMGSSSRDTRDRDNQVDDNHVSFDDESPVARQPDVQSTQEFPSLGNSQTVIPNFNLMKTKGRGNLTIRSSLKGPALAVTDENFPALGLDAAGGNSSGSSSNNNSKTVNLSVYSNKTSAGGVQQRPKSAAPNVSIRVNHNTNGSITTRVSGPNIRIRPSNLSMDSKEFPALGRAEPTTANTTNIGQWTKVTCTKPTISSARANKVAPAPLLNSNTPSPPPMSNCDAFPSLPKSARTKKQSASSASSSAAASSSSTSTFSSTWNRQIGECLDQNTGDAAKNNSKKKKKKKVKQTDNESSAQLSNDKVIDNQFESFSLNNKNDSNNDSHKSDKKKLIKDTAISNKSSVSSPSNSSSASASLSSTLKKTNDAPRKRSELQIENLNKTTNELHIADDFTEFDDNSTKGFKSNPPPGFGTTAPPPPGFAVKLINRESENNDNGLTFTNSSGESYSILPDKSTKLFTYTPPPDFQKRNQDLVARITKVLDQESIEEFRYISGLFRQDLCSAEDYYKHCSDSMGVKEFGSVFSEMLVLLPDIQKQRQLYDVHKNEGGNIILLEICPTCDQVVKIGTDAKAHYSNHSLDSHFPALGRGSGSPLTSNTWRKNT
ncbi:E3 ubiquitin-protein ligase ZNF598 [Microplitis demolitor]|uniref:E3 ubiquitin-protein ligase ZNF598 n=1 Tax=Microplitis demolitor TaxID=69319 RepID=UPI000440025E|nr:E3 ubiquitin-protein ligase ZNF598 [Microplitis demolitor]